MILINLLKLISEILFTDWLGNAYGFINLQPGQNYVKNYDQELVKPGKVCLFKFGTGTIIKTEQYRMTKTAYFKPFTLYRNLLLSSGSGIRFINSVPVFILVSWFMAFIIFDRL